jgi:hypothetical protein
MPHDFVLCGLFDQISLTRETYHLRKRQELAPSVGLTVLDQRERTETAEAAWKTAEAAMWRHMASRKAPRV